MVSHGKVIEEIFAVFDKESYVDDDISYNWTGMLEL
jgi:hypothetical protein